MISAERRTKETSVEMSIEIHPDGNQTILIDTGCGFMNHMLELLAFHGGWSLEVRAKGDGVDDHHLVEDLGIVLGTVILGAVSGGNHRRYGWCALPMDGTLVLAATDLGGRGNLVIEAPFPTEKCGDFDMELIAEFWRAFVRESRATVHLRALSVDNSHHLAEAIFKGAGQSLGQSLEPCGRLASTKGVIL